MVRRQLRRDKQIDVRLTLKIYHGMKLRLLFRKGTTLYRVKDAFIQGLRLLFRLNSLFLRDHDILEDYIIRGQVLLVVLFRFDEKNALHGGSIFYHGVALKHFNTNTTPTKHFHHLLLPTKNRPRLRIPTTRRRLTSRRNKTRQGNRLRRRTRREIDHGLLKRRMPKGNHRLRNISTRSRRQATTGNLGNINSGILRPTLRPSSSKGSTRTHCNVRRSTRKTRNPLNRQSTINTLNGGRRYNRDRHHHSRPTTRAKQRELFGSLVLLNGMTRVRDQGNSRTLTSTGEDLPNSTSTPTWRRNARRHPICMLLQRSVRSRVRRSPYSRRQRRVPRKTTKRRRLTRVNNHIKRTRYGTTRRLMNLMNNIIRTTRRTMVSSGVRRNNNGTYVSMELRRHFRLLISTLTSKTLTRTMTTNGMGNHRRKFTMNRRTGNRQISITNVTRKMGLANINGSSNRRTSALRRVRRTRQVYNATFNSLRGGILLYTTPHPKVTRLPSF